jgi:hypothetical protein
MNITMNVLPIRAHDSLVMRVRELAGLRTVRLAMRAVLFFAVFVLIFLSITKAMILSNTSIYSEGRVIRNYSAIPPNTIDVFAIGPSTTLCGFASPEMFESYGITAYNFGTSNQPTIGSSALFIEALKRQSPKVLVLDMEPLVRPAIDEASYRKVVDLLPLSLSKLRSVYERSMMEGSNSLLSYLLPSQKYHTNWKSFSRYSFNNVPESEMIPYLLGHYTVSTREANVTFTLYNETDGDAKADYNAQNYECMERILELCESRGISVLLVAYPMTSTHWTEAKHNASQAFADEHGLSFLDFNVKDVFENAGLIFPDDIRNGTHVNTFGAIKCTQYLYNNYIISMVDLTDRRTDPSYIYMNQVSYLYRHWVSALHLQIEKDFSAHLSDLFSGINNNDYTLFISVRDEASGKMGDALKAMFATCGFTTDFTDKYRHSFIGVMEGGRVKFEQVGGDKAEKLAYSGVTRDGTTFSIESAGYEAGNASVITLNGGSNRSKNQRGFNVVVYDNVTHRVIDTVNWDTCGEEGGGLGRR